MILEVAHYDSGIYACLQVSIIMILYISFVPYVAPIIINVILEIRIFTRGDCFENSGHEKEKKNNTMSYVEEAIKVLDTLEPGDHSRVYCLIKKVGVSFLSLH